MRQGMIAVLFFGFIAGAFGSELSDIQKDWLNQARLRWDSSNITPISCEEDSLGGVDGVIDGKWGFHTAMEADPWWLLDLESNCAIVKLRLYNRCDNCSVRNEHLIARLSDDGINWKTIWQNDGKNFYGATDSKPLEVCFDKEQTGRYLRLTLSGMNYLHLDEVEVYTNDLPDVNIALGKKGTQSSVSQWSTRPPVVDPDADKPDADYRYATPAVIRDIIESGRKLIADLAPRGIEVSRCWATLDEVEATLNRYESPAVSNVELYFQARAAIRDLAFSNPLIHLDSILFAKNAPAIFPHVSDQYYCWWQRGGGAICLLNKKETGSFESISLTDDWANGTFFRPSLSYDGKKVLFAYARFYPKLSELYDKTNKKLIAEDAFFHLYEMEIATRATRQLTFGKYDDFDARYLPNGDIVFLSTRKGKELQTSVFDAEAMRLADLPDSYVRCGGDTYRPVPVFSLHTIDPEGKTIRQISAFENFEWTPTITNDGRIAYARWDYIDRFNGHFFSLWVTNPDGTKAQLLYGNYTIRPQVTYEPAAVPGSSKLMFTASAHHSNFGGSLVLFDRSKGTEYEEPIERITPDVPFPETEGWPAHYFANPFPFSEDYYLVSWSNKILPPHCQVSTEEENPSNSMGIYYYDRFGNLELLYRNADISAMNPMAVMPREVPPVVPSEVDWDGVQEGEFLVQDVYEGLRQYGFTPETHPIDRLRIVATVPKVQPFMNTPSLGVSSEETGKFILGTVPVESDGSAFFRLPSGIPYFFQALDKSGVAIQTMRSLTYLMPGESAACIGCHEDREMAPVSSLLPLAAAREPSKIQPDPTGSFPLKYVELVQPVLDKSCVSCHSPKSRESLASSLDLTASQSYQSLLSFGDGDLKEHVFERDYSTPGDTPALKSKLMAIVNEPSLIAAHGQAAEQGEVFISPEDKYRISTWIDTYAQRAGSFSEEQEAEIAKLKQRMFNDNKDNR